METAKILMLFIALVSLVLGILNLRGKFVDTVYARRGDERVGDKGQRLARAVGFFVVSLFCIWRAFRKFDDEFLEFLFSIIIPVLAAGVLVPPTVEWLRNRKSKVIMSQIIAMALIIAFLFIFLSLCPPGGVLYNFASFFIMALMMVFLVICIYAPRRYGLTIAIVVALVVVAVFPDSCELPAKVLGILVGTAAAYGLDYLLNRFFSKPL